MAEIDEVKERINFYKTVWVTVVGLLAVLLGWFVFYDKQDAIAGLALVSIVFLVGVWVWLQLSITRMIRQLRDL
jgi:glucan phosphoethanolaminetransferase (alkaline phosphatase superfamily)